MIIDALDDATIKRMEEFFLVNSDQDFTGWHNSLELHSPDQKAKIYEFLSDVFDEHIRQYLDNYRAITGGFVSKKSDPGSVVRLHPDWAFVNEAAYTSVNLWIPLCETDANNGALTVLKGSHRIKQSVRGIGIPLRMNFSYDLAAKYLTVISMKPGWILLYDHRLLHGSGANQSGRTRTAAAMSLIPSEATPLHYLGTEAGVVELEIDAGFYHHCHLEAATDADAAIRFSYSPKTDGYKSRKIDFTAVSIDEQDLLRIYEPRVITAFRRIKDRLKAKIAFR